MSKRLLIVLAPAVISSKVELTKTGRKALREEKVGYEAGELCLFKNDNNSWCFFGQSPMMRVGWDIT